MGGLTSNRHFTHWHFVYMTQRQSSEVDTRFAWQWFSSSNIPQQHSGIFCSFCAAFLHTIRLFLCFFPYSVISFSRPELFRASFWQYFSRGLRIFRSNRRYWLSCARKFFKGLYSFEGLSSPKGDITVAEQLCFAVWCKKNVGSCKPFVPLLRRVWNPWAAIDRAHQ